jgi:hypothetical protein
MVLQENIHTSKEGDTQDENENEEFNNQTNNFAD